MDAGIRVALAEGLSKIRTDMQRDARGRHPLVVPVLDRTVRGTATLIGFMLRSIAR